jgi:ATP-dependent protease HslVU (ClpYQ) peptidase subunit
VSTVVVCRRGGSVAIAADSLVTFGDTRMPPGYEGNEKVFRVGPRGAQSWIGAVGSVAHVPVLRHALATLAPEELRFDSKQQIFQAFVKLHPKLKEGFFLNTKEHDSDPYESSQFSIFIVNRHGAFGVESYREVFEYERFWALGSGRRFALGAMHAAWNAGHGAADVARAGVLAGCEFDTSSAAPVTLHVQRLAA